MSLEKKIASGVAWVALGKVMTQVFSFLVFIVVARFIGPDEFGLAALCYVFMALFQLVFAGMSEGVVTLQVEDKERLSSLFWATLGVGLTLSILCYLSAGTVAGFYEAPKLEGLLKAFSIFPFIVSLQAIQQIILMKDMDFRAFALRSFLAILGGGVVGIYMASKGYGAMSLIMQQNIQYAVAAIIFWCFSDWRPSFYIKTQHVTEIIKPGIKKMISDGLNFIKEQSPRVLLGYFLGATSVGLYGFSHRMSIALQEIITNPVFMVLFPALSKAQNEPGKQELIYKGFFFLVSCLVAPTVVLAVMTAPLYVPLLFGDKWIDATPVLQVVLAASLILQFGRLPSVIFRVYNKVHVQLCGEVLLIGIALILIWFAAQHSALAVAGALLITTFLYPPILYSLLAWKLDVNLWSFLTLLFRPVIAIIPMIGVVYAFMEHISIDHKWLELFCILACGGTVYVLFAALLMRNQITNLFLFMKSLKSSQKQKTS